MPDDPLQVLAHGVLALGLLIALALYGDQPGCSMTITSKPAATQEVESD